jgi:hypothetical protein
MENMMKNIIKNYMKLTIVFMAVASLTLSLSVLAVSKTEQYTSESTNLLSQLQEHIRVTLLAVSDNERRAGKSMHDFHYLLSVPAQEITYLGLILELDNANNGYEVLSVTPGSAADKLAIKSKDHILTINDITINNATTESAVRFLNNLKPGDILNLTVKSKESERKLTVELIGQYVPSIKLELGSDNSLVSMETDDLNRVNNSSEVCGRVSIGLFTPEARDIYPATIHKIDDDNLKRNRNSFKLPIGKHTIFINEHINIKNFNNNSRSRRKAKSIEIDVKQHTTYHIGAKFNRNNKFKVRNGEYWTPTVWKKSNRECNL